MLTPPLRRRMACWLYEGVLMFGVLVISGLIFSIAMQMRHALEHRHAMQAFLVVVCGVYFVWFWVRGHTLAMKTWHIRITDRHGRPLGYGRALWRYLLCWVWFLPPLGLSAWLGLGKTGRAEVYVLALGWVLVWALLSRLQPQGQFWHDMLAGTRLIDARPQPAGTDSSAP